MGGREEVMVTRPLGATMQFSRNRFNNFRMRPSQNPMRSRYLKSSSQKKISRDPSPTEMSVEPWVSPQHQAAAEHRPRTPPSPPFQDQDQDQEQHPDQVCVDSYFTELETIRQGSGYTELDIARRDSRQSEEGEQEEQWLADAGLSTLISEDSEDVDNLLLMSTLTRTQAEAVQRRVDSYTKSLRKRNKTAPPHIRDVFSQNLSLPDSQPGEESAQNNMASASKASLSVVTPEHQRSAVKEEEFKTDVAYCEQAKLNKLAHSNIQWRREDSTLPRVICPKCRLGVTRVQDLSHGDMKKVRQLALIDMTALCDLLELEVKRHKTSKRKMAESSLFGVPLATLLENDQKVAPNTATPRFLQELLTFLEKRVDSEGILRVPGSQSRIKLLQQNLEASFYSGQFRWDEVSPNDAAALLKKFIRELPAPLLTAEYLNTFSAVRDITDLKQKLHMLNLLILLLPESNRNTLKALLEFLSKVVSREKRNRMNLWAVATIMAPNLFLHKAVPSRLTEAAGIGQVEKAADVMRLLIRYQDLLWRIPIFVMSQVRKLNEHSGKRYQFYDRRFKNLLKKIHTDSREKADKNISEVRRTVKVHIGDQVKGTMELHIDSGSRASDVLNHFYQQFLRSPENGKGQRRRNGSVSFSDCALYEVGGNIGEHRLDPDTHLLDLYKSNSGGEWLIKLKANGSRGM
ncbi:rho GTPase-activating protein 40 isoform X2 [Dunckerocampus dactyliophorus]|uniref:rho GTPase-activating protein 40 isoform X2 n=1 Tax=Dunckerocampus dactyliophorus TaxID=161453 RepID=UPI00240599B6|nr:rho GTPase-activating protein 40 isoform X2 [Dunckerocampus dactyliophorus]